MLLPVLTQPPLTLFHTKALAALSDLLGKGMQRYMASTTAALIESMAREREESVRLESDARRSTSSLRAFSRTVWSFFLETITTAMTTNDDRRVRIASCQLLSSFVLHNRMYWDGSLPLVLQSLLELWNEDDVEVVNNAWDTMEALSRAIPDERMSRHIDFIQSVLTSLQPPPSATQPLHGLTIKKGLAPFLPGFQHALLHGVASARVSASDGLGLLVVLSSEATLAPHVIKLTGPLIRIVGDRFPADVKASILHTLQLLIVKCGRLLKPFVPQLQTTFVKCLQDESASVRGWAAVGLSDLMLQSGRVEVVVNELLALLAGGGDDGVRSSVFVSLSGMFANAEVGGKVSSDVRTKVNTSALQALSDANDGLRKEAARCLSDTLRNGTDAELSAFLPELVRPADDWAVQAGQAMALAFMARELYGRLTDSDRRQTVSHVQQLLKVEHEGVQVDSVIAAGELLVSATKAQPQQPRPSPTTTDLPLASHHPRAAPRPPASQLPPAALRLRLSHRLAHRRPRADSPSPLTADDGRQRGSASRSSGRAVLFVVVRRGQRQGRARHQRVRRQAQQEGQRRGERDDCDGEEEFGAAERERVEGQRRAEAAGGGCGRGSGWGGW